MGRGGDVVSMIKLNTKINLQASYYKSPRTAKNELTKFVSELKTQEGGEEGTAGE